MNIMNIANPQPYKTTVQDASRSLSSIYAEFQLQKAARKTAPKIRDSIAIAFVALTVTIIAYSGLFNTVPILLLYVLWYPQIFIRGLVVVRPSADMVASLLLPMLACFSAFWSDYRTDTLHHGLEFVSMLLCIIIMARTVRMDAFVKGIIAGTAIALIATIINGTYGRDYFSGTYSLVGLFGSKNQVGFTAQVGILAAVAFLMGENPVWEKILFSILPLVLFSVSLYLSKSATATLSLFVVLCVLAIVFVITWLPRTIRWPVFAITAVGLILIVVAVMNLDLQDKILAGFGKDSTLTGRTYLWQEGYKIGWSRPVLGHGYSAFWVPGQPQAERYWYEFQIYGKSGFHFHELFIQTFVDLGFCGLAIIVLLILSNLCRTLRLAMRDGMNTGSVFLLALSTMFLVRAFVEVDFLGPFGTGVLLFYSIIPRLATISENQPAS